MNFVLKYKHILEMMLSIIIPIIGVLFLNFSIGDIYLLFLLDFLLVGFFGAFKGIICAGDTLTKRILHQFLFGFKYYLVFFLLMIITGHFFNGAGKQMNVTITKSTLFIILINHLTSFFLFIAIRKENVILYNTVSAYFVNRGLLISVGLLLLLLPFSSCIGSLNVNYFLAIALIITKGALDYIINKLILKNNF